MGSPILCKNDYLKYFESYTLMEINNKDNTKGGR